MEVADFCSTSRVIIVAGKGGVGKTTVTAALAVTAARAGRSVLIVEVEGKSGPPSMFGAPALGYDEIDLDPRVRARFLTPDAALVDYLVTHGMKRISKRLASSGALDVVATAVPGMKDILVLGKVKSIEESRTADLVIVDAPAAGHAVTFLLSARGLLDAVRVGPIRKQAQDVVEPDLRSGAVPGDARDARGGDAGERSGRHRVRDRGPGRRRARARRRERLLHAAPRPGRSRTRPRSSTTPARATDSSRAARPTTSRARPAFLEERHALQQLQIDRLRERLPLPQIELPFVFDPDITRSQLDVLADAFRARDRGAVSSRVEALVDERRVVICCGTGGVGKTTTAAVIALEGARRGPQRVRRDDRSRAPPRRRARHRAPRQRPDRDRPRPLGRRPTPWPVDASRR